MAARDEVGVEPAALSEEHERVVAMLGDEERAALSAALAPVLARPDVQAITQGVCR